ncbi:M24 family metallopeptidase [Sediminivirga luteola]|uniref:M24 family metallopeptidase n=1 Tax=Sediminivirga luteola TaxID=1774748 RepID=UPI00166F4415|nr:Xaa-Pro peptidase family protein [Sediminivirga luteola]MCI2264677.1 Xaa-Pro peptidase family protein [Sediminivirga luteola]
MERLRERMRHEGLDWVLIFEPENLTYISGFFTNGYATSFGFLAVPMTGEPVNVVRKAEAFWFRDSRYPDSVVWWEDWQTVDEVVRMALAEAGVTGRVGYEGSSWRANARLINGMIAAYPSIDFVDVGLLVTALRFTKSPAEIEYQRKAGKIVDAMYAAAQDTLRAGTNERDFAAEISRVAVSAGSDWAQPGPISTGERAFHIHASYEDREIVPGDRAFLEFTPRVLGYHARAMRTAVIGEPAPEILRTYDAMVQIQESALQHVRAGVSCRPADAAYRDGMREAGIAENYINKTFYSVGLMLPPISWEPLQVTSASDFTFEEGMTFHTYLSYDGLNISDTIAITADGYERLTNYPRELMVIP